MILKGVSSNLGNNNKTSAKKKTRFKTNHHGISDTVDSEEEGDTGDNGNTADDSNEDTQEAPSDNDAIQVNETKSSRNNAHPGDVRRVLGQKNKPKNGGKMSVNNVQWKASNVEGYGSDEDGAYSELGQWGAPNSSKHADELQHGNHPYSDWNSDSYWKDNQFFQTGDW